MLSLKELQEIGVQAEMRGYRVNIMSPEHAIFMYEYIPNYDLIVTYSVVAGEAKVRTVAEGVSCDPNELYALNKAICLTFRLICDLGGIEVE